jgi:hypothetical protein
MERDGKEDRISGREVVEEMLAGLPIVGAVTRSDRWPELDREPEIGMKEYVRRVWVKREQIENRIKMKGLSKNTRVVWESSLKDCEKGFLALAVL